MNLEYLVVSKFKYNFFSRLKFEFKPDDKFEFTNLQNMIEYIYLQIEVSLLASVNLDVINLIVSIQIRSANRPFYIKSFN